MRIKSRVWHWLAAACGVVGLLYGLGVEGSFQTTGTLSDTGFTAAFVLVLLALLFLKLGFIAQDREQEAKRRRYGKIDRSHARNTDYPAPEYGRRDA